VNKDRRLRPPASSPGATVGVSDIARTLTTAIVGVLATGLGGLAIIAVAAVRPTAPTIDRILRIWARTILLAAGVRIEVRGIEKIEKNQAYVVIANHRSVFDLVCPYVALPMPIRFLAKRELLSMPLFGSILRSLGTVPVDRAAVDHASINIESANVLRSGYSLVVFAEGTRVESSDAKPFKKGGFIIARQDNIPILPVTMIGTGNIVPPHGKIVHKADVTVIIGDPIPMSSPVARDLNDLVSYTQQVVRASELAEGAEEF